MKIAKKEAFWAFCLTLFYLAGWCLSAYFVPDISGVFGYPLWFELSCIFFPLFFCVFIAIFIKIFFKDVDLNLDQTP